MSVVDESKDEQILEEISARISDMFEELEVKNEEELIQEIAEINKNIKSGKLVKRN
jgi:TRAP-type C4-dicarboxylate transport system substrate-binding protein